MSARNALEIEVLPDDPEVNLDEIIEKIKQKLPKYARLESYRKEPFVYGMYKLRILVTVPEREGIADEIEKIISEIEGVSAEVVSISRI